MVQKEDVVMLCLAIAVTTFVIWAAITLKKSSQEKAVADCSFKGELLDKPARLYECPNGLIYAVKGNLRNAKGE